MIAEGTVPFTICNLAKHRRREQRRLPLRQRDLKPRRSNRWRCGTGRVRTDREKLRRRQGRPFGDVLLHVVDRRLHRAERGAEATPDSLDGCVPASSMARDARQDGAESVFIAASS